MFKCSEDLEENQGQTLHESKAIYKKGNRLAEKDKKQTEINEQTDGQTETREKVWNIQEQTFIL